MDYVVHMCTVQILALTAVLVDGSVDNLILRDHTIGLCWFCPAQLSDRLANDIEGQTAWFTGNCTERELNKDF